MGADGGLTEDGRRLTADLEERTGVLAASAYATLTDKERAELLGLLQPFAAAVGVSGDEVMCPETRDPRVHHEHVVLAPVMSVAANTVGADGESEEAEAGTSAERAHRAVI